MLFGIPALLAVGASWSLVGVIFGDAPKRGLDIRLLQFFGGILSLLAGTVIALFFLPPKMIDLEVMAWGLGSYFCAGLLNYSGLQAMGKGMQLGPNGAVWGIMQSALIAPFLAGVLLFGQPLTIPRLAGIILLVAALIFFAKAKNLKTQNQPTGGGSWRFYAFLAFGFICFQQNFATAPSYFAECREISPVLRALAMASGSFSGAGCMLLYQKFRHPEISRQIFRGWNNKWLYIYTFGQQFYGLFFAYLLLYPGMDAMAEANAGAVCYPLMVGSCIVSFSLFAIFVLKEKATRQQITALGLCLPGLAGLCFPADILPLLRLPLLPWLQ